MQVEPYLFFDGRCEEALEFYKGALGAEVTFMMRYKDSPEPAAPGGVPAEFGEKVVHAYFRIGETSIMAADDCTGQAKAFQGFSLSIRVPDAGKAATIFSALSDGGQVVTPLDKTFFSPAFGMVTDRFGVGWMVFVPGEESP